MSNTNWQCHEGRARLRIFNPGIHILLPGTVPIDTREEQTLSAEQSNVQVDIKHQNKCLGPMTLERAWRLMEEALSGEELPSCSR